MEITRPVLATTTPPADRFTGTVYMDEVAAPPPPARMRALSVHFTPGARTNWHTHPFGQTLFVLEGVGLVQLRGGPVEVIRPGDRVHIGPGEDHWHGAAPTRLMTHLAMQEADEQREHTYWGDPVTDEQYGEAPPIG